MKLSRNIITPYVTWTFFVLGLSGLLMLVHVFDGYTEVLHEIVGLFFVIFSVCHLIINWKSLKGHFKKRSFASSMIVVFSLSILLILVGKRHGAEERFVMEKLSKAPITLTFEILDIDPHEAEAKLKKSHIAIGESKTIEEIGFYNEKSSKKIIEVLVK